MNNMLRNTPQPLHNDGNATTLPRGVVVVLSTGKAQHVSAASKRIRGIEKRISRNPQTECNITRVVGSATGIRRPIHAQLFTDSGSLIRIPPHERCPSMSPNTTESARCNRAALAMQRGGHAWQ